MTFKRLRPERILMEFQTKKDYAYERIKNDILSGKLKPGDKIVLRQLAEEYGMSPIPIREAISQLFHEGLVHSIPYTGTQVAAIDFRKTMEITAARYEIESMCFRFALPYITTDDIRALRALLGELQTAFAAGDFNIYIAKNRTFYKSFYDKCPFENLREYSETLFGALRINTTLNAPDSVPESLRMHGQLLDLVEAGDEGGAIHSHRYQKRYSIYAVLLGMEKALLDPEVMKTSPVRIFFQAYDLPKETEALLSQVRQLQDLFDLSK